MKTVALISGGKDSCYNMMQCVREGHNIVALANLRPKEKDEIDSYMYQTVGHHAIDLYAEAMELPLYRRTIVGSSVSQGKVYEMTATDEVEDLYLLLKQVKEQEHIDAVSVGAILSDYQRVRVEHVCQRLNLIVLAYLWRRDQAELLQEMIECGVKAIIIKVAALGLDPKKHLGMTLKEIYPHMIKMQSEYGLNICGEGGEYETFTLDCPLFKKKIVVDETVMVMHSDDAFAAVAFLNFSKMHLESKHDFVFTSQKDLVRNLPMKHSGHLLYEVMHSTDLTPSVSHQDTRHMSLKSTSKVSSQIAHTYLSKKYLNISGVVAVKSDTESTDFDVCTAMEQLKDILAQYQKSSSDILALQLCLQDMSKFSHINNIYRKYFDLNPPIRVCIESSLPENLVLQLDCVCNLTHPQLEVNTMHVQSLSHWAPANIGPYSQAKKIGSEVFIAGQIALCPANLNIIEGGLVPQTRLSLRHVRRILSAMTAGSGLHDVVTAICYVTNQEAINTVKEQLKIVYEQHLQDPDTRSLASFDVLYVVVQSLPKAALVEWQVFAVTNRNGDWQEWSSCEKNENYTSHLSMHAAEKDGDHILSFIIYVALTSDCCCSIKLEDVLCLVLDSVCKILKRVSENAAPLKVLRVFYRADLFTADEVSQAFYSQIGEYFQWLDGNLPGASFIPVLAFSSNSTLFSVYH